MTNILWTDEDNTAARLEGWHIPAGTEVDPAAIEKLDNANIFGSDEDAVSFVCLRARAGSEFHKRALRYENQEQSRA